MQRAVKWLVYVLSAATVFGLGFVHARDIGHYSFTGTSRFAWMIAFVLLLWVASYGAGLPDVPRTRAGAFWATAAALIGATGIISLAQLLFAGSVLPRFVVFGSAVVLLPGESALTIVSEQIRRHREDSDRVVVVAGDEDARTVEWDLTWSAERPARITGCLTPEEAARDDALEKTVEDRRANLVVLDRTAVGNDAIVAQASRLHRHGVRIRTLSLFYDEWLGKLPVSELERMSLMFDIQEIHARRYVQVKRFLDLGFALGSVFLLVVATPLVAVLDLMGNRGPLFFRQVRVGKDSVPFTIVKFRTMPPSAADAAWTRLDDQRLAPVGRWLRRSHVDELPQALNILRGELSIVGPRPEQPHYVNELREKIPFYDERHLVKPGLTGWAQVKFSYGASVADATEKLQFEFYYLRHQSLTLDVRIIVRTLRAVLRRQGR